MKLDMHAEKIKAAVTCKQLLEANGTRVGHGGFAICPLHGDKDASLKVYGGDRGWVCYGCHKGGDVINLARELYGVGFNEAIRRLNEEFHVGLDLDSKPSSKDSFMWKAKQIREKYEKLEAEKRRAKTEQTYLDWLSVYRMIEDLLIDNEPDLKGEWSEEFCRLLTMRSIAKARLEETYWEWIAYG